MENTILITSLVLMLSWCVTSVVSSWELNGDDVTVLTGEKATLQCQITLGNGTVHRVWKDSGDEIIFFTETPVQADQNRMTVAVEEKTMSLFISNVSLTDESVYKCGLNGISPPVYDEVMLTVNQYPQKVYITEYGIEPTEGVEATVAKCFAKGAKPKPAMWFTDSYGTKIDVSNVLEESERDNGVFDVALSLTSTFTRDDDNTVYKCHVRRADETVETKLTNPIRVKHGATANLVNAYNGERKVMEEDERLEVTCLPSGYPTPTIEWTFQPDENTNITTENYWPDNFMRTSDGRTVIANKVAVTDSSSTNNGTFTCKASNSIGTSSGLTFHLAVYALPVTTVSTTPEATVGAEPRSAGSNGAVIGGVVAVAAFVLIVAVILIARYFMSHKGTYHTNEMKSGGVDEEKVSDDRLMDHDDDDDDFDDLSSKKRTEYFM